VEEQVEQVAGEKRVFVVRVDLRCAGGEGARKNAHHTSSARNPRLEDGVEGCGQPATSATDVVDARKVHFVICQLKLILEPPLFTGLQVSLGQY
jgi:hypothetical protein